VDGAGAVDQMDLGTFCGAYRANGQGRAAYDPAIMVALLLYAYAIGNRSSRGIERACREHAVFKVITAMHRTDHSRPRPGRVRSQRWSSSHVEAWAGCSRRSCDRSEPQRDPTRSRWSSERSDRDRGQRGAAR